RLAPEGVEDQEGNELFRELPRTVVVRAVGRDRRQAVCVVIGANEVIGPRLGCRVRTVRRVWRGLAERGVVRLQRAVHLVGRYVEETERPLPALTERLPARARRL